MLKFLLATMMALFLVAEPVSAAGAGAGARASSVEHKRPAARRKKAPAQPRAARKSKRGNTAQEIASDNRQRMVRRVQMIRGKRRVTYEVVRGAAPAGAAGAAVTAVAAADPRTAGDRAGLAQTRDPLSLRSNVAFVLDQNSSQVLFEKNANVPLPIASITKLMTGLVVVEAGQNMNEMLTVTDADVDHHKFSSSRLAVGTRMTRGNLLHIALMSSENRAAAALGRNYPGGIGAFVAAMNAKAHELGMNDTRYVDSSGLSSENVSSARDLAKLVAFAHQKPLLRQYSTDPNWVVEASGRPMRYNNTNYLVALPDWNIGLQKTGFINEAGRCLVMQAMIQGRNVIMVFLDSKGKMSRTADAGRMRRWLEALTPDSVVTPAVAVPAASTSTSDTPATSFSTVSAAAVLQKR